MEQFLKQLDELLAEYDDLRGRSKYDDLSGGVPAGEIISFNTRSQSAINRIAGQGSVFMTECEELAKDRGNPGYIASRLVGVVDALRNDVASGYLQTQAELIHGELFADFLEMSQHLLDEGYKDAAAVIAGSSLEAHLRKLCEKNAIDTEVRAKPKKADLLNSELAKADVYSKQDQKNVTAWLGTRNDAAHGDYDKYGKEQIALLVASIRDFIMRNPA